MRRSTWWTLGFVTAVGSAVRFLFLFRTLGYDEAYSYLIYVSQPIAHIVGSYYPNNHVLHTLVMAAAASLVGSEPWALRLPALMAGVACIPASFVLGRRLYSNGAGLIAAALTAGSSVLIEYSTNARGYTMVALATLVLFSLGAHAPWHRPRGAIIVAVVGGLGLFTVPVMLFSIVAWNLWMCATMLSTRDRGTIRRGLWLLVVSNTLMLLFAAILYLPAVQRSGLDAVFANRWVQSLPFREVVSSLPLVIHDVGKAAARDWPLGVPLLTLAMVAAIIVPRGPLPLRLLVPVSVFALVMLACVQRVVPHPRMLIMFAPLLYVTGAIGISMAAAYVDRIHSRHRGAAPFVAAFLVVSLSAAVFSRTSFHIANETGALSDAPQVAEYLTRHAQPGDIILVRLPGNVPLHYYMQRLGGPTGALSLPPMEWRHQGLASANRVFLVVNAPVESVADVDAELGDISERFTPAEHVASFPHASVFIRVRQPGSGFQGAGNASMSAARARVRGARFNGFPSGCGPGSFVNLPNSTGKGHWGEGITAEDMTTPSASGMYGVEVARTR